MEILNMGMWWQEYPQSVQNFFAYIDANNLRGPNRSITDACNNMLAQQGLNARFKYDGYLKNIFLEFPNADDRTEFELRWS